MMCAPAGGWQASKAHASWARRARGCVPACSQTHPSLPTPGAAARPHLLLAFHAVPAPSGQRLQAVPQARFTQVANPRSMPQHCSRRGKRQGEGQLMAAPAAPCVCCPFPGGTWSRLGGQQALPHPPGPPAMPRPSLLRTRAVLQRLGAIDECPHGQHRIRIEVIYRGAGLGLQRCSRGHAMGSGGGARRRLQPACRHACMLTCHAQQQRRSGRSPTHPPLHPLPLTSQGATAAAARPPRPAARSTSSTSPVEQSLESSSGGGLRWPLWCVMVWAAPCVQSTTSTLSANEAASLQASQGTNRAAAAAAVEAAGLQAGGWWGCHAAA